MDGAAIHSHDFDRPPQEQHEALRSSCECKIVTDIFIHTVSYSSVRKCNCGVAELQRRDSQRCADTNCNLSPSEALKAKIQIYGHCGPFLSKNCEDHTKERQEQREPVVNLSNLVCHCQRQHLLERNALSKPSMAQWQRMTYSPDATRSPRASCSSRREIGPSFLKCLNVLKQRLHSDCKHKHLSRQVPGLMHK